MDASEVVVQIVFVITVLILGLVATFLVFGLLGLLCAYLVFFFLKSGYLFLKAFFRLMAAINRRFSRVWMLAILVGSVSLLLGFFWNTIFG